MKNKNREQALDNTYSTHDDIYEFVIGNTVDEADVVVGRLVFALGFRNKLIGTQYLKEAILTRFALRDLPRVGLNSEVYPAVADKLGSTVNRVERAIRNSISDCYDFGNLKAFNELLKCPVISLKYTPTNGELVSSVVNWLKIEQQQNHIK